MTRILKYHIVLLLMVITTSWMYPQTVPMEDIKAKLEEYCINTPWEELYTQTDRDIYVAGEEIWFCSYLTDRQTGKLSLKSNIAYFELLNPENIPVIQKRLLIKEGICPGSAHLPDTLASGTYTFRIYTNWMKNFLPGNAFMKEITIVNPFRNNSFKEKIIYEERLTPGLNIAFYPEGGILLNGLKSKVGVKAYDEYQRGIAFEGIIKNNKGDSVASFKTDSWGLGSFDFIPTAGNSYYMMHGGTVTYLPLAREEGCAMRVEYIGKDVITIDLNETGAAYSSDNQQYSFIIQSSGNICYSENFRIPGSSKTIIVSAQGLPQGINQLILFNQNLVPVCERLIYNKKNDEHGSLVLTVPENLHRRENLKLDLDINSVSLSNLSISVIPVSYSTIREDINDYLLFGTEFGFLPWRSYDHEPVKPDNISIDNFLLTAKSRWINWNDVNKGRKSDLRYERETNLHFLSGVVNDREAASKKVVRMLTLSIPGKVASYYNTHSDEEGYFNFNLPVDQVQKDLIIQPGNAEDNISVEITSSFSRILPYSVSYHDSVPASLSQLYSGIGARYQINMIFGAVVKKELQSSELLSENVKRFYGKPEIELIMDDYIKLPVMQEVFFELAPGVRLREKRTGYEMRIVNPFTGSYYDEQPTSLIDGVVISDMGTLAGIDPEIVERIDIVKTPYLTGDYIHNGIVHVITRTGKFNNLILPDNAVRLPYRVTEPVSLFVSPDYSDPAFIQSRKPDFRNTLFWNPSIIPGDNGKISVDFRTSDIAGDYIIEIQGVTSDGIPVSLNKVLTVNR